MATMIINNLQKNPDAQQFREDCIILPVRRDVLLSIFLSCWLTAAVNSCCVPIKSGSGSDKPLS